MKIRNILDKQFKVMVVEMLSKHWRRRDECSEDFREIENVRKYPTKGTDLTIQ